jgi:hypothetical protein
MNATIEEAPVVQERFPLWRGAVVLLLAALAVIVCLAGTPPAGKSETAIKLDLPTTVGAYYGTDEPVSDSERAILPKDTEFAKKLYSDGRGGDINCQIVLAGAEKRSIHRPEICLVGQGWTLKSSDVLTVPLANGKTLDVMKLLIGRPIRLNNGQQKELNSIFIYWFVGKDTTTPYHLVRILKTNLDMLLHNTNHRWAYVIVSAPILEGLAPNGKNQEQTLGMLKQFIGNVVPDIVDSKK